jgi:hypothetical protein
MLLLGLLQLLMSAGENRLRDPNKASSVFFILCESLVFVNRRGCEYIETYVKFVQLESYPI